MLHNDDRCTCVEKKDDLAEMVFFHHSHTYIHKAIICLSLSLSTSPSLPLSASPKYMISQWERGSEERFRFLRQQQLVHLFTPNFHANEAVSLRELV